MKYNYWIIETLRRFFSLVSYRKIEYIKYLFQSIIRGINIMLHIVFLQKIVYHLENSDKEGFINILYIYIIVIIVYELLWFITRKWWWVETMPLWAIDIYKKYIWKYIRLDNTAVEKIGTGKLLWIIQTWTNRWVESLADVVEKWTEVIVAIIFSCYLLSQYNSVYIIYFILFLLFFLWISVLLNNHLFQYRNERYELRNSRLGMITKILMSKNEVLQTNRFDSEMQKLFNISYGLVGINKKMSNARMWLRRFMPFTMNLFLVGIFFIFWMEVLAWNMLMSQVVWMTGAIIIIQSILTNFLGFYVNVSKNFIDIQKLWDFFDTTPEMKWYDTGIDFEYKKWDINLKNIWFWYTDKIHIFDKFNLDIEWWKITALVWNSGSWKSTLVKMIAGYIHADKWDITIDKQQINEISLKSYYRSIWYLTQEPSVFDGTIYDNLTYALEYIPKEEELDEIIKLSKCEFIYDLEYGINTEIWEKWIRLSGGQRQRLAIAKIFLKNPKIIILDEPTSALDSFSEEQITKAMHNLFNNRTVIIIAHRLQTVKHADKILVLENGKIIEQGKHDELVKEWGQYAKMLELQSGF